MEAIETITGRAMRNLSYAAGVRAIKGKFRHRWTEEARANVVGTYTPLEIMALTWTPERTLEYARFTHGMDKYGTRSSETGP